MVLEKLLMEIQLGRMSGPFSAPPLPNLVVSPLGVVPKGASVHNRIDLDLCSVVYTSFDTAVEWVKCFGKGLLLAFCLLPVLPDSLHLLVCFWDGGYL